VSQQGSTSLRDRFNRVATNLTARLGSPYALVAAVLIIVVWAVSGPFFNFSETWQLVINTGTTIITFLMVFVIQASQNRDSKALHLKLDEVIRALEGARNELIAAESSTEEELQKHEEEFLRVAAAGAEAAAQDPHPDADPEHVKEHATRDADVRAAARSAAERQVRRKRAGSGSRAKAAPPKRG
jgi:low affinity Fe/Cu permease